MNHIQDVPFEINMKAWEVVRWCFDNGREPCDSFPPLTEVPVEMVTDLTTLAAANDNGDADTDARIKMRDAIKHNLAVRSHLVTTSYLTDMVETIGDLPFWHPTNFDFRSRMYPVPVINYQSADHIKALHYFVLRKPLGERGLMPTPTSPAVLISRSMANGSRRCRYWTVWTGRPKTRTCSSISPELA